jgi:hypothetical protein
MIGVRNGDEGGQMQYGIAAFRSLFHAMRITDIAGKYFKLAFNVGCAMI